MALIAKRTTEGGERRYDVRYRLANGKVRTKTFHRAADAEAFKRTVEGNELIGLATDHRGGSEAFEVFAKRWMASRLVKGRPLSPSTLQGYEGLLRRNIYPSFEGTPLRKITPDAVRSWHGKVTRDAGQDQAAKSYRLLRAILTSAVDDELLARNPCRIKGGGQENAPERPMVPTSLVLDLADAIAPRFRALVLLAGFAGLRTGEQLGLTRADIDLLRGEVHVRQQAQQVVGAGRVVKEPKSDAGRRVIALPRAILPALEEHLAAFAEQGLTGAMFTGGPMGRPATRRAVSEAWRAAVTKAGAPEGLRPHDLRHHAATLMARMPGVTTKELMARIGHASPRAALIYQHATAERDRAIADFLDRQIASVEREPLAPVLKLAP